MRPEQGFTFDETRSALRHRLVNWINANRPANTMRTCANAQNQFRAFCDATARSALPATPETVTAFMKSSSERGLKASTINGPLLSGISNMHADACLPTPTNAPIVKRAKQIVARLAPSPRRTVPIAMQAVTAAGAAVDRSKHAQVRDFTMLLFATCASMRPAEVVALWHRHVTQQRIQTKTGETDAVEIHIDERKNDQTREGHTVLLPRLESSTACPFTWTAILKSFTFPRAAPDTPFFCKSHKTTMAPLSRNTVKTSIRRALIRGGVSVEEAKKFVANSARAGGFSAAVANGTHPIVMKHHGGWKSDAAFVYLKETNDTRLQVTKNMFRKDQPQFHHYSKRETAPRDGLRVSAPCGDLPVVGESSPDDYVCQEKAKR